MSLVSQYSWVQLADKQQAMNHCMFFPTAQCWIIESTLQSQLQLSQQIYVSDQSVTVHQCGDLRPGACETIFKPYTFDLLFFLEFLWRYSVTKYWCINAFYAASRHSGLKLWTLYSSVKMKASALHHKCVLSGEIKTVISQSHTHIRSDQRVCQLGLAQVFATCVSAG